MIGRRSINNNNIKVIFSVGAEPTFLKLNKVICTIRTKTGEGYCS